MNAARPRIGIVGAGQLARMTALAAAPLDVEVGVLAERPDEPAVLAAAHTELGAPSDPDALRRLAAWADVVTFDHEHVPPALLGELEAEGVALHPRPAAKLLAQDKVEQRARLGGELGLPVPRHAVVATLDEVEACLRDWGGRAVLKDARGGYDGHGVAFVDALGAAGPVLERAARNGVAVLAEEAVDIDRELAVVLARAPSGRHAVYPVVQTVQRAGICREILAPAPVDAQLTQQAQDLATTIADAIDATGILAVELFVTARGELLVNELALRPHNSGHFTLTGCVTSQFENHVRSVLDWPLGDPSLVAPAVATANVLGAPSGADPLDGLPEALAVPGAAVQLYGKAARPGRKLGHVTVAAGDLGDARRRAAEAAGALGDRVEVPA